MQLFIKNTYRSYLHENETITNLKERILYKSGYNPGQQHLIVMGRRLDEGQTLYHNDMHIPLNRDDLSFFTSFGE